MPNFRFSLPTFIGIFGSSNICLSGYILSSFSINLSALSNVFFDCVLICDCNIFIAFISVCMFIFWISALPCAIVLFAFWVAIEWLAFALFMNLVFFALSIFCSFFCVACCGLCNLFICAKNCGCVNFPVCNFAISSFIFCSMLILLFIFCVMINGL